MMFAIRHRIRTTRIGGAAILLMLSQFGPAQAAVLFNQINPANTEGHTNQIFGGSFRNFNVRLVDDFTLARESTLTSVTIDLFGFTGTTTRSRPFVDFAKIEGWSISIWNIASEATRFRYIGGVLQRNPFPNTVTFAGGMPTIPAGGLLPGESRRVLVTLPIVNAKPMAAGTYWLSVTPVMPGEFGTLAIATHGTGSAFQHNDGTGFRFPNGTSETLKNAGFRLEGTSVGPAAVPEPASWAMMIAGFGLVGAAARRRRTVAVAG
jgi:hypothetical protein